MYIDMDIVLCKQWFILIVFNVLLYYYIYDMYE